MVHGKANLVNRRSTFILGYRSPRMTERIYTICLVVSDAKAFLTDLPYATVDVCPKAVATGHTLVEVE